MNMIDLHDIEKKSIKVLLEELRKRLGAIVLREFGQIPLGGNYRPDGYVMLGIGAEEQPLVIEVKGHVSNLHQIKNFMNFARTFDGMTILIAEAIADQVKEQLKMAGIGYFELNNELHLPLKFKITDEKQSSSERSITENQGFRVESNLKILFYFMSNPESLKYTQREISQKLGISLGTVNLAIKNLEKVKVIQNINGTKLMYGDFNEIIERWRIAYGDIEKNKLLIGRFSPVSDGFFDVWDELNLSTIKGYWGGEAAASLITNRYLSPGIFTIYSYEANAGVFIKDLKLKKDPKGKIEILKAFWPEEINRNDIRVVPEFLILCDLLNSGIDRNRETAQKIKRQLEQNWKKEHE